MSGNILTDEQRSKGHKSQVGRPKLLTDDIRRMIRAKTNWNKAFKIMHKMAFGGFTYMNGNGVSVTALPDKDWFRMLMEYAYGKPIQLIQSDEETKDALAKFTEFVSGVTGKKAVDNNGKVVERTPYQSTDDEQTTEKENTERESGDCANATVNSSPELTDSTRTVDNSGSE